MTVPYVKQILAEYAKLVKEYETIASSLETQTPESNPEFGLGKLTDALKSIKDQWHELKISVSEASSPCILLSSVGVTNIRSVLKKIVKHALIPVLQSGPQYSGPEQIWALKNFIETNLTDILFCANLDSTSFNTLKKNVLDSIQIFSNLIHGDNSIKRLKDVEATLSTIINKTIEYGMPIVESNSMKTISLNDIIQECINYCSTIETLANGGVAEYKEFRFQAKIEAEVYDSFVLLADFMSHTTTRNINTPKRQFKINDLMNQFLKSFDGIYLINENGTYKPGEVWKAKMRQVIPMYLSCIPYKSRSSSIISFQQTVQTWKSKLRMVYTRGSQVYENDLREIESALDVLATGHKPSFSEQDKVISGFEKVLNIVKHQLNSKGSTDLDRLIDRTIQGVKKNIQRSSP